MSKLLVIIFLVLVATQATADGVAKARVKVLVEATKSTAKISIPVKYKDQGVVEEVTNMMPPEFAEPQLMMLDPEPEPENDNPSH